MLHLLRKNVRKLLENYQKISSELVKGASEGDKTACFTIDPYYDLHIIKDGPPKEFTLSREEALRDYRMMDVIRKLENTCASLYRTKIIRGFCHLYAGQEAVAAGIKASLQPGDCVITSYRVHGICYAMGGTVEEIISELAGKACGISRGKGGSMHMYADNLYGGNGIVASHIPVGVGLGLAHKYRNSKGISVTMYGDGATNQGQTFESFNLAKLLNIPVLYVVENNLYGLGTHSHRAAANPKFYTRCEYIPGIVCDGMDYISVRNAVKWCMEWIRNGNGPIICECKTYRYYGHSMSDPGTSYRSRDEIQKWREEKDCLKMFKKKIVESGLATDKEIGDIANENKKLVEKAAEKSSRAQVPDLKELGADVYIRALEDIRGVSVFHPYKHYLTNAFKRMPGPD